MRESRFIDGKKFHALVFRIESRKADGTPELCRYVAPTDVCELSGRVEQNHFIVGYFEQTDHSQYAGQIVTEGLE